MNSIDFNSLQTRQQAPFFSIERRDWRGKTLREVNFFTFNGGNSISNSSFTAITVHFHLDFNRLQNKKEHELNKLGELILIIIKFWILILKNINTCIGFLFFLLGVISNKSKRWSSAPIFETHKASEKSVREKEKEKRERWEDSCCGGGGWNNKKGLVVFIRG